MKNIIRIMLLVAILAVVPACSSTEDVPENAINMINPFVDHASLKEAERGAGFRIRIPEAPFEVTKTMYRENIIDPMLEIIMYGKDNELRIRKAPGKEDISGNWNEYETSRTITIGRNLVTIKGNGDRLYQATWTSGRYSFSAYIEKGLGEEAFLSLIGKIR